MAIVSRLRRSVPPLVSALLLSLLVAGCESNFGGTSYITRSVAIGDLDGNGRPDLVVADGSPCIRYRSPTTPGAFLPPTWLIQ